VDIQDSGPTASTLLGAADTLVLDESRPGGTNTPGGAAPRVLPPPTGNTPFPYTTLFRSSDGPGSTVFTLKLTGSNVASGLFALGPAELNSAHQCQALHVCLNQLDDTITGSANGTNYFTITINETSGAVTFTQLSNIWHSN